MRRQLRAVSTRVRSENRGVITVAGVLALLVATAPILVGVGRAPSVVDGLRSSAWVVRGDGSLVEVDGLGGDPRRRVDLGLVPGATVVLEDGTRVLVLDDGELIVLDGEGRYQSGAREPIAFGDQLVGNGDSFYTVDSSRGRVQHIPAGSSTADVPVELRRAVGRAGVDPNGVLWVGDSHANVFRIAGRVKSGTVDIGADGPIDVVTVGDRVVAVRRTGGTVHEVTGRRAGAAIDLGDGELVVPHEPLPDGRLFLVRDDQLLRVDLDSGEVDPIPLPGVATPPVVAQGQVVVVADGPGGPVLVRVDVDDLEVSERRLTGLEFEEVEVRSRDGLVYISDPGGDTGYVVDGDDVRDVDLGSTDGIPSIDPDSDGDVPPSPLDPDRDDDGRGGEPGLPELGDDGRPLDEPGTSGSPARPGDEVVGGDPPVEVVPLDPDPDPVDDPPSDVVCRPTDLTVSDVATTPGPDVLITWRVVAEGATVAECLARSTLHESFHALEGEDGDCGSGCTYEADGAGRVAPHTMEVARPGRYSVTASVVDGNDRIERTSVEVTVSGEAQDDGTPHVVTDLVLTPADGAITAAWTPAASGPPPDSYLVGWRNTRTGELRRQTEVGTQATRTGLVSGDVYEVSVRAAISVDYETPGCEGCPPGAGVLFSDPVTATATPTGPSAAPGEVLLSLTSGDGVVEASWVQIGSPDPDSYLVEISPGEAVTVAASETFATFDSLTNGQTYTVTVTPFLAGTPGPSSSAAATPTGPVVPRADSLTLTGGEGSLSFTATVETGGTGTTCQLLVSYDGGGSLAPPAGPCAGQSFSVPYWATDYTAQVVSVDNNLLEDWPGDAGSTFASVGHYIDAANTSWYASASAPTPSGLVADEGSGSILVECIGSGRIQVFGAADGMPAGAWLSVGDLSGLQTAAIRPC